MTGDIDASVLLEPQFGGGLHAALRCAVRAEECGFSGVFTSDHLAPSEEGPVGQGPLDAWLLLTAIAAQVPRIRVGTLVSPLTVRHPMWLALAAAQLDVLSGGRATLGVGAGWSSAGHDVIGITMPAVKQRFELLDEGLELIRRAWSTELGGPPLDFEGRYVSARGWVGAPSAAPGSRPPVVIGGGGGPALSKVIARYAEEYNAGFMSPQRAQAAFGRVRAACGKVGRHDPIRMSVALAVYAGRSTNEAERRVRAAGEDLASVGDYGGFGTVSRLRDRIAEYRQAGAEHIYVQIVDMSDLDHIELLADVLGRD